MSRPEGGVGGGWPDEHETYGDSHHESWRAHNAGPRHVGRRDRDRSGNDWLTERWNEVPRYNANDQVTARTAVGGGVFKTVPAGTRGRVVSTRGGLFHDYVTVQFENGYTEEVKTTQVDPVRSWW